MQKAAVFETTYKMYLDRIAGIDIVSRADVLGATVSDGALVIPFYGIDHRVAKAGVSDACGQSAGFAVSVALCCYVLQCPQTIPATGDWVSYREFKDAGPLVGYFTANTSRIIETTFAGRPAALKAACRGLNGRFVDGSPFDLAVVFDFLPRIPVYLRFNDRDDAFPAQVSVLFRRSAEAFIDMECLAFGGTWLAGRLAAESAGE